VIGVLPEVQPPPLNDRSVYSAFRPVARAKEGEQTLPPSLAFAMAQTWQEADAQNQSVPGPTVPQKLRATGHNPSAQVSYYSVPLQKGETETLRPQVVALMLAAGLILLIACANLAGLTLVRVPAGRTPEIATRLALGASRWQVLRQLWIENFLRAFVGGAVGVAVGFVACADYCFCSPSIFYPWPAFPSISAYWRLPSSSPS